MDEQQQYELVCKPQLKRIEGYCSKIFNILEGKNGAPGIVSELARHDERIKSLQAWKRWAIGFGTTIVIALIILALTHNWGK